ncbi:hypothetical protein T02_1791 [Trichinella nativa]|uniref:Uncharacterized protein n=1 Tax=Trichinella nativa TaxID=6335 RepID=A0A0V1L8X3_9BILA|nr:hypothetical protein T06_6493 [Trichinella sp. T6]KRZ55682.1 hypothetical protein T02_1791 [Trichinella nativa]
MQTCTCGIFYFLRAYGVRMTNETNTITPNDVSNTCSERMFEFICSTPLLDKQNFKIDKECNFTTFPVIIKEIITAANFTRFQKNLSNWPDMNYHQSVNFGIHFGFLK